eukprot:maker-scaffold736_size104543-snap-gene-0.19 protein:Tk05560 transcript:maker-scaffold736_size104543-snap-gene-0.19-mRNA-1 annotation:"hypothetical protein DAPPUDRAFT_309106"
MTTVLPTTKGSGTRKMMLFSILLLTLLSPIALAEYSVGIGIADVTGPAAEIGMMGYAKGGQNTAGIHTRLFSRAFVFDDGVQRGIYVSVDMGMMGQLLKLELVDRLHEEFGNLYNHENVIVSGTHTHSGPAGYLQYVLFDVTCLGFDEQTFQGLLTGIVESIRRAHNNMKPAKIFYVQDELHDANINRSPTSYLVNPEEERAKYEYDTDHLFTQLNIVDPISDEPLGVINWFAVHPVSMNNSNHLISSDNKGAASIFLEQDINGKNTLVGKGPFVSAFASTNLGDVSPNLKGPKCRDTGLACDTEHSTCDDRNWECIAFGPGEDIFESTLIIADRQYEKSKELLLNRDFELAGPIKFAHQWINMSHQEVTLEDGSIVTTCPPAMGYGFAAGTTDGPGQFDFVQGTNDSNPFWDAVSGILKDPSPEQEACHSPKPILLDTGEITFPYLWHPYIIDTQVMQLGQLFVGAMPGELTTMAGRRMRDTILGEAIANGAPEDSKVVIAGLSNVYTHYITTFEEYQRQRYEAASTLFGPHTLHAYQQQYSYLTRSLVSDVPVPQLEPPASLHDVQISLIPGVMADNPQDGLEFGACLQQPPSEARAGETVIVSFVSGNPRNDINLGGTYLTVDRNTDGNWKTVHTDADWETRFYWKRTDLTNGESNAEIWWQIPNDVQRGEYRITHNGFYKDPADSVVRSYSGQCDQFAVI